MHSIENNASLQAQTSAQSPTSETTAGGENRRNAHIRHIIEGILWFIGLVALGVAAFIMHMHHGPWPGELEIGRAIQSLQLGFITGFLLFLSDINNPIPASIAVGVWIIFMLVMRWFRQALFFALTVGVGNGIDALIGDFVGRPRPNSHQLHVNQTLTFNSFPSGHSEHVVVYYGFLLYLSFTKPVREWRYRWWLLPLQIFAVLNILAMGFARLYQGEHWITDVLGGYLSGLVWLFLFIFIYRWATDWSARRKQKKQQEKQQQTQVAG